MEAWRSRHPLFDAVYLCGRDGRVLYPVPSSPEDGLVIAALRGEISQGFWDRGGRRHLDVDGRVVLAAVLQGSPRGPLLIGLRRDDHALGRDVLGRALAATEGRSALVVVDASGRSVWASRPARERGAGPDGGLRGGAARLAGGALRAGRPGPARHGAAPGHDSS